MPELARNFYSPNAILFSENLPASELSYLVAVNGSDNCVKEIFDATGYDKGLEFYSLLCLPDRASIEDILKKFGIENKVKSSKNTNLQNTLNWNELINTLMKYNLTVIKYVSKLKQVQKAKYIQISDFIELVDNRYFSELESRVPASSRWSKYPRFIKSSSHCEAHASTYKGTNTSCYHIRFIRQSSYDTDPISKHMPTFAYKAFGIARYQAQPIEWLIMLGKLRTAMAEGRFEDAEDNVIEFRDIIHKHNQEEYLDDMAEEGAQDYFIEPDEPQEPDW